MEETKEKISTDEGVKKQYTLNSILKSSLNSAETDKHRADLNEKIQKAGGEIGSSLCSEAPKRLVYPINKESQGYFCECSFDILPEDLKNIKDILEPDTQIVRYMLERRKKISVNKRQKRLRRSKEGALKLFSHTKPESLHAPSTDPLETMHQSPETTEPATPKESATKEKREKVNMEEIEKKLDEIIDNI